MAFDNLTLIGKVRLTLDREREQFIVQMRGNIQMDIESVLDLSRCS